MYTSYWGLREEPFQNLNDLRYAYLSEQHSEGLARLLYLARGRKQGGVLTGPYGVGKSMILELLGQKIREAGQSRFVRIDAPPGGSAAFVRHLLWALGYDRASPDPAEALQLLGAPCAPSADTPAHTVIAVDEAQMIHDHSTYEFLHLLTNLRATAASGASGFPAFTLLLCGHGELMNALFREQSLCQRLSLVWKLEPLDERQTGEYIHYRMRIAGATREVFEPEAIVAVHATARGLPRLINNICDLALMIGSVMQAPSITREIVNQAVAEMETPDLLRTDSLPPLAP
jgi:general secretion pathway protein A